MPQLIKGDLLMPNLEPKCCECKTCITDDTLLIKKNEFVLNVNAFICAIVNVTMQHSRKSERINMLLKLQMTFWEWPLKLMRFMNC